MNTIKSILSKTRKGIKKFVEEKIEACKEILSSAQNRLTLGLMILGIGVGVGVGLGGTLILSAYMKVPE